LKGKQREGERGRSPAFGYPTGEERSPREYQTKKEEKSAERGIEEIPQLSEKNQNPTKKMIRKVLET